MRQIPMLGVVLFACVALSRDTGVVRFSPTPGAPPFARAKASRSIDTLPTVDRAGILDAYTLAARYGDSAWTGWGATAFPILLVAGEREYLVTPLSSPTTTETRVPAGFASVGIDSMLRAAVHTRTRIFPSALLATFPLGNASPVVVIGQAEATGKSPAEWVLTLLHEHFHQLQFAQPRYYDGVNALDLARGDTTGMWALNYAFPYDSARVQQRFDQLTHALVAALDTFSVSVRPSRIAEVRTAYAALHAALSANDARYLNFQLWQEGVARYTEYRVASVAAADAHASALYGRSWPTVRDSIFRAIVRGTAGANLAKHRREVVYPVGAAVAIVLDAHDPTWRERYFTRPFELSFTHHADSPP